MSYPKYPRIFRALFTYAKLLAVALWVPFTAIAQDTISLYPGKIPNSRPGQFKTRTGAVSSGMIYSVVNPTLEIYLPERSKATGAAVIICPGGGYKVLTYQAEGVRTAMEFSKNGVAAFVLKYRLPDDSLMVDKKIGPLQDAQQAIKLVREHAVDWGLDEKKVGIMGFSAGGHLAATAATHFNVALIENDNHTNLRPAFLILVYPVISMQKGLTHSDSRINLLGTMPSTESVDYFSNELQVNKETPPTYITHAGDDKLVDVDNSILFYESLRHANVPAELHLFAKGGHGFVLGQRPEEWMSPIFTWLSKNVNKGP
jgi:acetyl esterase/lipase